MPVSELGKILDDRRYTGPRLSGGEDDQEQFPSGDTLIRNTIDDH